jgi:hypothetical protein
MMESKMGKEEIHGTVIVMVGQSINSIGKDRINEDKDKPRKGKRIKG